MSQGPNHNCPHSLQDKGGFYILFIYLFIFFLGGAVFTF